MAHILFVHPLFLANSQTEREMSSPYFPLGLLYLAGYVREAGHTVSIFDGTFCPDESAFDQTLAAEHPDVVGISALQPTRETALTLAAMAARVNIPVILGGPDPTLSPMPYLASDAVDLVVHHEGERTITELLTLIDSETIDTSLLGDTAPLRDTALLGEIKGIAFRSNGRVTINQPRAPIDNLDTLPPPARDLIDMDRYLQTWEDDNGYSSVTIATSRGCPFGCSWCQDSVHGQRFRQRSPESVAAEVAELARTYDVNKLRLTDDIEGIDSEWFHQWAAAAADTGVTIPFEPLNDIANLELSNSDIPMLDVGDSL